MYGEHKQHSFSMVESIVTGIQYAAVPKYPRLDGSNAGLSAERIFFTVAATYNTM